MDGVQGLRLGAHGRALLALCGAAVVTGCGGPGAQPPESAAPPAEWPTRNPAVARIEGTVTRQGGAPVEKAVVEVAAVYTGAAATPGGDCSGAPGATGRTLTDASGAYRLDLSAGAGPDRHACLRVRVQPPAGSGLAARTLDGVAAEFRAAAGPASPVRVDVVLSP